ncbi:MAG: hypothetical protein ACYS4W_04245 [Planctomycetota bacterium]
METNSRHLVIALIPILVPVCFCSCQRRPPPIEPEDSHLYRDLTSHDRDWIYRAIRFIEKVGGPRSRPDVETTDRAWSHQDVTEPNEYSGERGIEYWKEARKPYVLWLRMQDPDFFEMIAPRYEEFVMHWAPYYTPYVD